MKLKPFRERVLIKRLEKRKKPRAGSSCRTLAKEKTANWNRG